MPNGPVVESVPEVSHDTHETHETGNLQKEAEEVGFLVTGGSDLYSGSKYGMCVIDSFYDCPLTLCSWKCCRIDICQNLLQTTQHNSYLGYRLASKWPGTIIMRSNSRTPTSTNSPISSQHLHRPSSHLVAIPPTSPFAQSIPAHI